MTESLMSPTESDAKEDVDGVDVGRDKLDDGDME